MEGTFTVSKCNCDSLNLVKLLSAYRCYYFLPDFLDIFYYFFHLLYPIKTNQNVSPNPYQSKVNFIVHNQAA